MDCDLSIKTNSSADGLDCPLVIRKPTVKSGTAVKMQHFQSFSVRPPRDPAAGGNNFHRFLFYFVSIQTPY